MATLSMEIGNKGIFRYYPTKSKRLRDKKRRTRRDSIDRLTLWDEPRET